MGLQAESWHAQVRATGDRGRVRESLKLRSTVAGAAVRGLVADTGSDSDRPLSFPGREGPGQGFRPEGFYGAVRMPPRKCGRE